MMAFFTRFNEVAGKETRVVKLPQGMMGLPADEYALVEFYCEDPACDCRRVIIQIWTERQPGVSLASFSFGWESKEFYRNWTHGAKDGEDMHGLSIEPLAKQTRYTEPLMALVDMVIREDPAYVERLKRHYQMFKAAQSGSSAGADA
jgi:hypothetical protein